MKKHQFILLTTVLFVVVFYDETLGLNLGILGFALTILTYYQTPHLFRTRTFYALLITSFLSSFAFAWFADFPSFLAVFTSFFLLILKSQNKDLKSLLVIPLFAANFVTFIYRFFQFGDWLPKHDTSGFWQKIISVFIIPLIFVAAFFGIYSMGSEHFANFFNDWEWNFNFGEFILLTSLGVFLMFNFWNFKIYKVFYRYNHDLKNDLLNEDKIAKATFSFMSIDAERNSGVMSLVALNILLVFFIITYNYEQFFEVVKSPNKLSAETHDRVNAVIMSIVMAIVVLLFYFKSNFNFDVKAKPLSLLARLWIILNAVLVISAGLKNLEYIDHYGFTYKRLGVFAFLVLSLIGLVFTYLKILYQKTNAYLFNQFVWYLYGTILVCSFVNWGGVMTRYNSSRLNFDLDYHKNQVDFNEKILLEYAAEKNDQDLKQEIETKIQREKKKNFLSKILFFESIDTVK